MLENDLHEMMSNNVPICTLHRPGYLRAFLSKDDSSLLSSFLGRIGTEGCKWNVTGTWASKDVVILDELSDG